MKRLILFLVLSLPFVGINAQEWEIVFDDSDNSYLFNDVCKVDDNVCLYVGLCGVKLTEGKGVIMKMSSDGDYETRVFDVEDSYSNFMSIVKLDDGNFFIVGWLRNHLTDSIYIWNVVMDDEMNIIRENRHPKDLRFDDFSDGRCVKRNNGNVVFTCCSKYNANSNGCYIVEYNSDCAMVKSNLLDHNTGYSTLWYYPNSVIEIPGSDEIIVLCKGYGGNKCVLYFDSALSLVRSVNIQDQMETITFYHEGYGIIAGDNNIKLWLSALWRNLKDRKHGVVVGNYDIQAGVMSLQTELMSGNPYDTIYCSSWYNGIAKTTCGKLLCYGNESVNLVLTPRLFIFDEHENFSYSVLYEDYQGYSAGVMLPTNDGGCLIQMKKRVGDRWITVIKKISSETLSVGEHALPEESVRVYPNPASDRICLQLNDDGGDHQVTICDIYGRTACVTDHISAEYNSIYIGNLKPGVYFCYITDKEQIIKKAKFVKI